MLPEVKDMRLGILERESTLPLSNPRMMRSVKEGRLSSKRLFAVSNPSRVREDNKGRFVIFNVSAFEKDVNEVDNEVRFGRSTANNKKKENSQEEVFQCFQTLRFSGWLTEEDLFFIFHNQANFVVNNWKLCEESDISH